MPRRRLFVIWSNPLFRELLRLLLTLPEVDWVGATSDHAAALDQIRSLCPDTILIEAEEAGSNAPAETLEILEASSMNRRVFRLSLADNELKVYHREQKTVGQAEDLLRFIDPLVRLGCKGQPGRRVSPGKPSSPLAPG